MKNLETIIDNTTSIWTENNTVLLKGDFDQITAKKILKDFFTELLENLDPIIIIDVRNVNYLNSGSINSLVHFVLRSIINTKVYILIDDSKSWQQISFKVFSQLDQEKIVICRNTLPDKMC